MMVSAYLLPHGAIYLNDLNRVKPQNGEARPAPAWDLQSLRKYVLHIRLTSLSPQKQQKPASNSDLCDSETLEPRTGVTDWLWLSALGFVKRGGGMAAWSAALGPRFYDGLAEATLFKL